MYVAAEPQTTPPRLAAPQGEVAVPFNGRQLAEQEVDEGSGDEAADEEQMGQKYYEMLTQNVAGIIKHHVWLSSASLTLCILSVVGHMMPHWGQQSSRLPPAWGPEMADRKPFREYSRDVMVWSIMNPDLSESRKAAAIVSQLRGAAAELGREIPAQTLVAGGPINGVMADPMTYVMHILAENYAVLGEEQRLHVLTELMTFARRPNEITDHLISRFDAVRLRASQQGQMQVSIQGLTWILLRAIGCSEQQLITLLQPLNGQLPGTLQQYRELMLRIRRMSHIIEGTPMNIGSALRGRQQDRHDGQHFANTVPAFFGQAITADSSSPSTAAHIFPAWAQPTMSDQQWAQPMQSSTYQAAAAPAAEEAYPADYDSGTDTDTSSSDGNTAYHFDDIPNTSNESELFAQVYWAYSKAKGRWRRMTGKPVRRVRRFLKRRPWNLSPGKGKGNGKNRFTFLAEETDENLETIFKGGGKGKGSKGRRTTGKGFGRKTNPRDKHGNIMACHRCGSTEHLIKNCPHPKGGGKGFGQHLATPLFHSTEQSVQPHQDEQREIQSPFASIFNAAPPGDLSMSSTRATSSLLQSMASPDMFIGVCSCVVDHENESGDDSPGPLEFLLEDPDVYEIISDDNTDACREYVSHKDSSPCAQMF